MRQTRGKSIKRGINRKKNCKSVETFRYNIKRLLKEKKIIKICWLIQSMRKLSNALKLMLVKFDKGKKEKNILLSLVLFLFEIFASLSSSSAPSAFHSAIFQDTQMYKPKCPR